MSLVITGNPGVGKHTVAKSIAKELKYTILDINQIAKEGEGISKENHTHDTLDVDITLLQRSLKNMTINYNTIIVGHLAPYVLSKEQVQNAIILRKNPYKLSSIYKERGYSKKKSSENIASEILGIISYDTIQKFGKTKTIQIDATDKTDTEITSQIIQSLNNKESCMNNNDSIDWLSLFATKEKIEDDLQKFFSYS